MMRMGIIQQTIQQSYIFVSGRLFVVGFHLWPVGGSVGQVIISEMLLENDDISDDFFFRVDSSESSDYLSLKLVREEVQL